MQRLYGLGARKVAFNGLPPLGCIPAQRVKSATGECLDNVNRYAVQFNAAAKKLLDGMNARLPGAQMALADCYSVVMELIQHPQKHGNISANQGVQSVFNVRSCFTLFLSVAPYNFVARHWRSVACRIHDV